MREEEIKTRYQRDDENDLRGINVGAIEKFIEMLHLHEQSRDSQIRSIAENFEYIDRLAPNFIIFQSEQSGFMHNFNLYQISENADMLTATHEFGHAILSIMNHTVVPENYEDIIAKAKQYAISPENKENFKAYIQYLSGKTDRKEERTKAEKGPVSDIISSIFQNQGLRIGTADNICMFPASHTRKYYFDEENNKPNLKNIFDEDFANYYALKANNCIQEIETIRNLFGDELVQVLDEELAKASERLAAIKEAEVQEKPNDPMEKIKGIAVFSRQSEIQDINPLEKVAEKEDKGEIYE